MAAKTIDQLTDLHVIQTEVGDPAADATFRELVLAKRAERLKAERGEETIEAHGRVWVARLDEKGEPLGQSSRFAATIILRLGGRSVNKAELVSMVGGETREAAVEAARKWVEGPDGERVAKRFKGW